MYVKKISIITLAYNNCHLLGKAIDSVASQKLGVDFDVEYIILDDGSEFFDRDYVNEKLKKFSFSTRVIVNESNIGTVRAFNRAIEESIGDLIIPLSADDEFYDNFVLKKIVNEFRVSDDLVITGLRVPMISSKEQSELPLKKDRYLFENTNSMLRHMIFRSSIISGASTYYHREAFKKFGLFDERYRLLEDLPFIFKVLMANQKIKLMDKKVIKYGTEGVSSNKMVNPLLKNDFNLCYSDLLNYPLGVFSKRYVRYQRTMDNDQKNKLKNIIVYPEQYLIFNFKKIINR
ncbi:glycosyltransferase [Vibrio splendidus]